MNPLIETARPVTVWEPRTYAASLDRARRVREDLGRDLAGFCPDLVEIVRLCASELFANCVRYSRAEAHPGEVLRFLRLCTRTTLRVGFTDPGGGGTVPRVPVERDRDEWAWAEGQRGLAMVDHLSTAWGYHRTAPWADLGTHVWACFAVGPCVTRAFRPYVFTE